MTTPPPAPMPDPVPAPPAAESASAPPKKPRFSRRMLVDPRWLSWIGLLAGAALVTIFALAWWSYRRSHSITDDAFVEAHIVNIAPQKVSGRIVRFLIEEHDRVEQGQLLAEIDPVPYRDQVNIAQSKVDIARAELRR